VRILVAVVVVIIIMGVLGACSSGGSKKASSSSSTATSAPEPTVAAGAPKPTTNGGTTVTTAATSTTRGPDLTLTSFQSPSSNIGCEVNASATRCDIKERSWAPPPKPANCDLDWGQGIEISGTDNPSFVCAGDTALDPSATVLGYGQRTRQGSIVCDSEQAGVTCTNEAGGHGFFLSRDSYRIF
jgi:hypothetical protein